MHVSTCGTLREPGRSLPSNGRSFRDSGNAAQSKGKPARNSSQVQPPPPHLCFPYEPEKRITASKGGSAAQGQTKPSGLFLLGKAKLNPPDHGVPLGLWALPVQDSLGSVEGEK